MPPTNPGLWDGIPSGFESAPNPNGIVSQSLGLPASGYPRFPRRIGMQPQRGCVPRGVPPPANPDAAPASSPRTQPRWGWGIFGGRIPRVGRRAAGQPPGFGTESRWDSNAVTTTRNPVVMQILRRQNEWGGSQVNEVGSRTVTKAEKFDLGRNAMFFRWG